MSTECARHGAQRARTSTENGGDTTVAAPTGSEAPPKNSCVAGMVPTSPAALARGPTMVMQRQQAAQAAAVRSPGKGMTGLTAILRGAVEAQQFSRFKSSRR